MVDSIRDVTPTVAEVSDFGTQNPNLMGGMVQEAQQSRALDMGAKSLVENLQMSVEGRLRAMPAASQDKESGWSR